jgi:hypothetical protein
MRKADSSGQSNRRFRANVEPLPGHSIDEVTQILEDHGEEHVETLAPRMLSVELSERTALALEGIAEVTEKRRHHLL